MATIVTSPEPVRHFADRSAAGRALISALIAFAGRSDVIVLGLARGGVILAREVAAGLNVPFDAFVARKLGVPGVPEVALGAIAEGWSGMVLDPMTGYLGIPGWMVAQVAAQERAEAESRVRRFRGDRPLPTLRGRVVILVDDGLASGATLRAAACAVRAQHPAQIIAAVPIGSRMNRDGVAAVVDELIVLHTPESLTTVSDAYDRFDDVSDDAVLRALHRPMHPSEHAACAAVSAAGDEQAVTIPIAATTPGLAGDLGVPSRGAQGSKDTHPTSPPTATAPHGLVIFAHGGGSSRKSYRNRVLAAWLRMRGWATLRVDLLTPDEAAADAASGSHRFDLALITARLISAIDWVVMQRAPGHGRLVLFGASTGAAAAMVAATERPGMVHGVMSRGGRVDLAAEVLPQVRVPVLLVVGAQDAPTLRWNRSAIRALQTDITFRLVRGAGHVFDEPGALGAVGCHVERWLSDVLLHGSDMPRRGFFAPWRALRDALARRR
jgi:putative phosphoribosyl transferase